MSIQRTIFHLVFRLGLALCQLLPLAPLRAQPFAGDIRAFRARDSVAFPALHPILFVGSSSFTFWTDVNDYFPGYSIINRSFGGSSLPDLIRYAGDIIFPYHARQIVIYCGENDLAASNSITAKMVAHRFRHLFDMIRNQDPDVPVLFISLKPSPSRQQLLPKMVRANTLIKKFLKKKKKTAFIDVYHLMLNPDGTPMADIYKEDKLHMNPRGYAIWQKAIAPYLIK